ncbi:MAG: response regulator transcription factor [Clostridia bacterium]
MKILIVEDERLLNDALMQIMKEQKYLADAVFDGEDGYLYGKSDQYDIIILDVMLPKLDGFEVAKKLRKNGINTPILLLTARDEVTDKVKGLDSGADDYMTKPFSPDELLARVRALSRRQGSVILNELKFHDIILNLSTSDLACKNKSVHLGRKENEVLKLLIGNKNIITSKDELLDKIWGVNSNAMENNVEAYVSFLRKKFFFLDSEVNIGSFRKLGYRLEVAQK